jgi:hypothetical protein
MEYPVLVDGSEQLVQLMSDGDSSVLLVGDRYYRVHLDETRKMFYSMLKVGGHLRSLAATDLPDLIVKLVRVHRTYREYEDRCRRSKEEAARERDRRLGQIVDS